MNSTININALGATLFLVISLAYGYFATDIVLLPGEENEPFNSRTLPLTLSFLGACLSIAELFFALRKSSINGSKKHAIVWPQQQNILKLVKLIIAVCLYAFSLQYVGFLLATIIFIFACCYTLGERNKKTLFIASIIFVVSFWLLLKYGLDIYVEPGKFFK